MIQDDVELVAWLRRKARPTAYNQSEDEMFARAADRIAAMSQPTLPSDAELVDALETAAKRLTTIAGVRWAADKFDPYDLPDIETLRRWAGDARAALAAQRIET